MSDDQVAEGMRVMNGKLDKLLSFEPRLAVLESQQAKHDEVAREVASMRDLGPLKEKVARLEGSTTTIGGRVDVLERTSERRQGVTDGAKLVWLMIAGAPGVVAILLQLADLLRRTES